MYTHSASPLALSPIFFSSVARYPAMNIAAALNQILVPVMVPSVEKIMASAAPLNKVRTRQEKEPLSSTQHTASAVSVIHTASLSLPVASPQMMGNVPDNAMRNPQLIRGSKLSSWISLLSRLYDFNSATFYVKSNKLELKSGILGGARY